MGPRPLEVHNAIVAALGAPAHAARVSEARAAFQARTGAFGPEDAWFDARSAAFWDDAVTLGGLAADAELPDAMRPWADAFARAHRGLFVVRADAEEGTVLDCLVTGVSLLVDDVEPGTRDALLAASAPLDGRVVAFGSPVRTALLPGAIFHPADAAGPIDKALEAARAKGMPKDRTLDALLRMELSLRALSRVKASYAYRPEALRA